MGSNGSRPGAGPGNDGRRPGSASEQRPLRIDASMLDTTARRETPRYAPPPKPTDDDGLPLESAKIDFERGMSVMPALTLIIIIANTLIFFDELVRGALKSNEAIIAAGALQRSYVLDGEVWRLWSAAFLHGSTEHLVGNMIALYILGMALEHGVGRWPMIFLYMAGATVASLFSIMAGDHPSVGASGAIFALMGGLVALLRVHRKKLKMRDNRIMSAVWVWGGVQLLLGAADPRIDNAAHLGGFLAGWLVGGALTLRLSAPVDE